MPFQLCRYTKSEAGPREEILPLLRGMWMDMTGAAMVPGHHRMVVSAPGYWVHVSAVNWGFVGSGC